MDIDRAASELYALGLEDFTTRRDELAARARAAGDSDLAAAIKGLRKPTVVAWLANQLARHHAAELASLLELGESLRLATASLSGEDLRRLSRQRSAVVQALGRQAWALAVSLDRPVSQTVVRELEQTLLVALADPEQAADLEAGRLTERLDHSGFSGPAVSSRAASAKQRSKASGPAGRARAGAPEPPAAPAREEQRRAARRGELEAEIERAWRAASAAKDAHAAAQSALAGARASAARAERAVTTRQAELDRAESDLAAAASAVQAAAAGERQAADAAGQARAVVRARQRDLDDLPR